MPTALRVKTQSKTMIATTVQTNQVQSPALKEALALASNKEILVQVLAWDSCGTCSYEPDEIVAVKYKEDIVRIELTDGRATHLSDNQILNYWEQIQQFQQSKPVELSQEKIVSLAKSKGTAIYETGCKLGYVVNYKSDYYAVSEMLVHGKGFQYSQSRHSSFQLAVDALVEQSWVEEEVA
ncbi:hypothetical protein PaVLD_ORF002L [Planktothrix phage PaV-LD]|uniref:hypothetical protein n=1 Tax=Planktothrix phage PaV-LD TaxID=994601 RepID=UPI000243C83F|nr:hypothetical protein PaVLD_ORF002L [Planktothrix phage PaV-LD]ADZ31509.1 hypothetical protein PaVLD_ORF002L [Planktothrix phage PaV-LD]